MSVDVTGMTSDSCEWFLSADIDECERSLHTCPQRCGNIIGSYFCYCNSGYYLDSDGQTCIGTPCIQSGTVLSLATPCGTCLESNTAVLLTAVMTMKNVWMVDIHLEVVVCFDLGHLQYIVLQKAITCRYLHQYASYLWQHLLTPDGWLEPNYLAICFAPSLSLFSFFCVQLRKVDILNLHWLLLLSIPSNTTYFIQQLTCWHVTYCTRETCLVHRLTCLY